MVAVTSDRLALIAALLLVAAGVVFLAAQALARRLAGRDADAAVPRDLDRRRHQRRPAERVTALLSCGPGQQPIPVENISRGGMCVCVGPHTMTRDTVVQATLAAPGLGRPTRAEVRAVWVEGGRAGLAFTHVDVDLRGWLDRL